MLLLQARSSKEKLAKHFLIKKTPAFIVNFIYAACKQYLHNCFHILYVKLQHANPPPFSSHTLWTPPAPFEV